MAVILATGCLTRIFARCCTRFSTGNLPTLLDCLPRPAPDGKRTALLTYSNHISTLDEPLWNASLPFKIYTDPARFRWMLGAKDILFRNKLLSWYFSAGQVLETDRHGPGIYQPSIDQAIDILRDGGWVHIFPEGYVNQPRDYKNAGDYQLLRFKWGVSRILMEAPTDVRILPVYLKGFEHVMPEGRTFPWNFVPKLGRQISVTFGAKPLDRRRLIDPLYEGHAEWDRGEKVASEAREFGPFYRGEASELRNCRIAIAGRLRKALMQVQNEVEGRAMSALHPAKA